MCESKIGYIRKLFSSDYCSSLCSQKHYEIKYENYLKREYDELRKNVLVLENVSSDIKIKYIKLPEIEYHERLWNKNTLLKLINEWKNLQDKRLNIINIETWSVEGNFLESHEPWQSKIVYNFL